MSGTEASFPHAGAWHLLGLAGALIFYSRFYVQWLASEREGQSTLPEAFWHMSTIGSLALLVYAIVTRSPLGALGQCFNLVVYARNLLHVWRKRTTVAPALSQLLHVLVALITLIAMAFVISIWTHEFHSNQAAAPNAARQAWVWLGFGLLGQVLFAGRFLIQWIATERQGECTVPVLFWQLSVVATVLQSACFLQRGEWVFATGSVAVLFIYFRNLSMIKAQTLEARSSS